MWRCDARCRYVPGTHTQHVKGLSAEHLPSKYLAAFKRQVNRKTESGESTLSGKSCALVGNSGQLKRVRGVRHLPRRFAGGRESRCRRQHVCVCVCVGVCV